MPALWWVEMGLVPQFGRAVSRGVFWRVCELSITLSRLSADGWVSVLSCWLFGLKDPAL